MGQNRTGLSRRLSLILILGLLGLGVFACTLPRIIEMKDPLSAEEHNDLGVAYERKGLFDLAEKEYRIAGNKRPDWALPYFNLGNLYVRLGEVRKAEDSYRKALTLDENDGDTLNNLADLLCRRGKVQEAKGLIERALKVAPRKEYLDTYDQILKKEKSPRD